MGTKKRTRKEVIAAIQAIGNYIEESQIKGTPPRRVLDNIDGLVRAVRLELMKERKPPKPKSGTLACNTYCPDYPDCATSCRSRRYHP